MRRLLLVTSLLTLASAPSFAQAPGGPIPTSAEAQRTEPGRYWVFFPWNSSKLPPDGQEVVAEAARSFQSTGSTRISLVGSADRTGSAAYNEKLSARRADTVRAELERLGVPAGAIEIRAEGENAPLVPTPPGVKEARNRYVAIDFPEREATPPPTAPPPVASVPPLPPKAEPRWAVSLGLWYGHNLKETDAGSGDKTSDLIGPELRLGYSLNPNWTVYGDLVAFNTMNTSSSNGWGSRVALGVNHQWNLGDWHPYIGPKVGYIAGKGVEDGAIVGPELGLKVDLASTTFLYAQVAYDHDTRNPFDKGIVNGGLGLGVRF